MNEEILRKIIKEENALLRTEVGNLVKENVQSVAVITEDYKSNLRLVIDMVRGLSDDMKSNSEKIDSLTQTMLQVTSDHEERITVLEQAA